MVIFYLIDDNIMKTTDHVRRKCFRRYNIVLHLIMFDNSYKTLDDAHID